MATPNVVVVEKTVDDTDGTIEIDFVTDLIEVGSDAYNANIIITPSLVSPLKGIRLLSNGEPLGFSEAYQSWLFLIRAADGTAVLVSHMDGGTPAEEQIFIPVLEDTAIIAGNHVFGLWRGGPTRLNLYIPANVQSSTYATTIGTTAVTSGVDFVAWSYTLAETEVISGSIRFTGRAIDGGTTKRTFAEATFVASRSTAGVAEVTVKDEDEVGTIGVGSIVTGVDGNDVEITLNYTFTGDIDWVLLVDLNRVIP
jgi:hypothetical protein